MCSVCPTFILLSMPWERTERGDLISASVLAKIYPPAPNLRGIGHTCCGHRLGNPKLANRAEPRQAKHRRARTP